MSNSKLPERASLEYLKKLAKERLHELRLKDPAPKLAAAQLLVARDHGFANWRALKAEVERRQAGSGFFEACVSGNVAALREMLEKDPGLVRADKPAAPHGGWTGLHEAAQRGHLDAVRLLLERGADPNAREAGDNTCPLHWAAASRQIEVVRALLDAGGDVHGIGDVHELDVIGWATFFHETGGAPGDHPEVAALLVERGARHHIFSAMSVGDLQLIRKVIEQNPQALARRMSRFEQGLTAVDFAIRWNRPDILQLLIEMGAEAPVRVDGSIVRAEMGKLGDSVKKCVPMIYVSDVAAALDWYTSIGFQEMARYADEGLVNFGMVSFGKAEIMVNMNGKRGEHDVSLWLYTNQVDELYRVLRSREGIDFVELMNDTFYGARQFGIRDLNGYILYFIQIL